MLDTSRIDASRLDGGFLADCQATFNALPDRWVVTYGFRDHAMQQALWDKYQAGGPKAAPPGKSPHEVGLAIDVFLWDGSRLPNYDVTDPRWQAMFAAVLAAPRLHSGQSFGDSDHIEAVLWQRRAGIA